MSIILEYVNKKHASDRVKYHALYNYYFLGFSKTKISKIYNKSASTITNWIKRFEDTGTVTSEARTRIPSKFDDEKYQWLLDLYRENPTLYLDEAKHKFQMQFNETISASYICQILHKNNMSWKTLEKRAIQIRDSEIINFFEELNAIDWDYSNLVFLDEVAMDNQGLLRDKGYGIVGQKLYFRGEFRRQPRISMLVFLGQNGVLDSFKTDGTFTRVKFFDCCKEFALSGSCQKYPGRNSIWILDGAKIHCHASASIVQFFRSLGIFMIFLPPYTPFFNPIEIIFGIVKKHLKKNHAGSSSNMELLINEEFTKMRQFPCTKIFKSCGYTMSGKFDPNVAYCDMEELDYEACREKGENFDI